MIDIIIFICIIFVIFFCVAYAQKSDIFKTTSFPIENWKTENSLPKKSQISIETVPYTVSIQLDEKHICGGSIISGNIILTAAHCIYRENASQLRIRAGSSYHDFGGEVIQVKKIIQHHQYDPSTDDYDYALLELETDISFDSTKKIVKLADATDILKNGTIGLACGFGNKDNVFGPENVLRAVEVPVIDHKQCNNCFNGKITERMICAGCRSGVCQGDSGGPLVVDGKQHGIVSWGMANVMAKFPTVYANIGVVRDWITANSGV